MDKYVIKGGDKLKGTVSVSGAKNAALKTLVAACLTDEKVIIKNIPLISDFFVMVEIMKDLGVEVEIRGHTATVQARKFSHFSIPLDKAAEARTSSMFIAPLLARLGEAIIPNPGGCRLGARPIDRTIEGIKKLDAEVSYLSDDGYFHAKTKGLKGARYKFHKNSHTGTETMIMAAVLARGKTVLENAAEEPEIDDVIRLLNRMGSDIKRTALREITINGVNRLSGGEIEISPDRIEVATFAVGAIVTGGDIFIKDAQKANIDSFLEKLNLTGAGIETSSDGIRFYANGKLDAVDVATGIFPGFLTDWQALWGVLMTQAVGKSVIHETVFENKLGYIADLERMGAEVRLFNPKVKSPEKVYNFNLDDDSPELNHAVEIKGPTPLHNAVMTTLDIRAGAAVVLAALAASGTSTIFGIEKLDRGYENFDKRLRALGANIKRVKDKSL